MASEKPLRTLSDAETASRLTGKWIGVMPDGEEYFVNLRADGVLEVVRRMVGRTDLTTIAFHGETRTWAVSDGAIAVHVMVPGGPSRGFIDGYEDREPSEYDETYQVEQIDGALRIHADHPNAGSVVYRRA